MPETLMASTMTSISNKSKTTVVTSLECINLVQHSISFKIFADWISSQPWCNGKVGMYGKSWGGFNGLQVAFHQPPTLAAVISLYSTDDRFNDDIHWKDGCILGNGMLSWASTMFCWDARPPHPRYNPATWRQTWKQRLEEAGQSCLATWLRHHTYDEYWSWGSVKEDYQRIKIPVLAIGNLPATPCQVSDVLTSKVVGMTATPTPLSGCLRSCPTAGPWWAPGRTTGPTLWSPAPTSPSWTSVSSSGRSTSRA